MPVRVDLSCDVGHFVIPLDSSFLGSRRVLWIGLQQVEARLAGVDVAVKQNQRSNWGAQFSNIYV
jgi:hypothetical protein